MKTEVNEVSRKWERKAKMIKMGFRERREKERGKKSEREKREWNSVISLRSALHEIQIKMHFWDLK